MLGVVTRVSNDPRAVRMLICLGANVNTRFTRGRDGNYNMSSPLIAATVGPVGPDRMVRVMRMLLDAGADVNGRCEMVGTLNGTALLAAAFLGEPDAVRVLLERPEVDLHATGVGFRNGAPFASDVSAIDVARRRLWPWVALDPGRLPLMAFRVISEMLMRRLHEDCVALAQHALDAEPRPLPPPPTGGNGGWAMPAALRSLKADVERLQCTGRPHERELAALGRECLYAFFAIEAGRFGG